MRLACLSAMLAMLTAVCAQGRFVGCANGDASEGQREQPSMKDIERILEDGFTTKKMQTEALQLEMTSSNKAIMRQRRSSNQQFGLYHDVTCQSQTDQSQPFTLKSDPNGYPTEQIAAELFQRSLPTSDLLFPCLARVISLDDVKLEAQPLLLNGTTCPQALQQLWSYNSVRYQNSLCWALTNFQESILYNSKCQNKPCLGCSRLDLPFSYEFGVSYQRKCQPRYQTVSLWSYCTSLPINQRIVWDRIIVPIDCSCTLVKCRHNGIRYG